jgi:hypothetical protein
MTKRAQTLELLKAELSKLCTIADNEGFEMIAYFIETAMRESDEQLSQENRAVVGMELRMEAARSRHQ